MGQTEVASEDDTLWAILSQEGMRPRRELLRGGTASLSRHNHLLWPKAKVRPLRFHDLRHTTGSLLLMVGANPAAAQRILRHSDPRITTEVYGHLLPGYLKAEVDRLSFPGVSKTLPREATVRSPFATMLLQSPPKGLGGPIRASSKAARSQAVRTVGQCRPM